MVGRSKPQKKMEPKRSVDMKTAETTYLKAKNLELAKALAESKAAYTLMVEDRDLIQRELFTMNLRCAKLENYIKNMETSSRALMTSIVASSNHATDVLQNAHNALRFKICDDNIRTSLKTSIMNGSLHSSPSSNKTQAVKPMIGGHVILRPIINLRRVNEIPIEEIQRLQSGVQTQQQNTSRSSSENNISPNGANQNENEPASMFQNRQQPVASVTQPFRNSNETEDEYTDQTSDISDPSSETNNGLDTVQEEPEDLTSSSLANANNSTLNLSGTNSQVPLLSGVFRDVRVYLSPMPNVSQYLDPRQHVTTERGSSKTHKSKVSSYNSRNSSRSNGESIPRNTQTQAENLSANNTAQNQTNGTSSPNPSSIEESFSATLEDSLLSSTRIATPNRIHNTVTNPDDLNWLNNSNRCDRNNGLNISEYMTNHKRNRNRLSSTPEPSNSSRSGHNSRPSAVDYDPLEGPSNLLDSYDEETKNKIQTLSGLGLTPTFLDNSRSPAKPPPSPARTVLQRRERSLLDEKAKKNLYVVKRSSSSIEKKKAAILSTKVAKVIVKRLSLSKTRPSGSPNNSQRRSSIDSLRKSLNNSPKKKSLNTDKEGSKLNSSSTSSSASGSSPRGRPFKKMEKPPPKKKGRKSKKELSEIEALKNSQSSVVASPRKKGRPKRAAGQVSLKEPSLRKKLRRSK